MQNKKLDIKDSSISLLAGFLFSQLAVLFVGVFCLLLFKTSSSNFDSFTDFFNTAIGYLIAIIALDLGLFFVSIYYKQKSKTKFFSKISIKKILIYISIGICAYILLSPIVDTIDYITIKIGIKPSYLPYELTTKNYFISLISLVLLPAICEELLFRGIIFNGLKEKGEIFAILISALMFALFHTSINQLFYPFVMGVLLSAVMAKENNLFYPILIHFLNNFTSLTLSYFNLGFFFVNPIYFILAIVLFVVFVVLLYLYIKKFVINKKNRLGKQIRKQFLKEKSKILNYFALNNVNFMDYNKYL